MADVAADIGDRPPYSDRYDRALTLAAGLHRDQVRKVGTNGGTPAVPYVAHLLEVSAIVWTAGGDEDQAIAALLHDSVEDQGERLGPDPLGALSQEFGARVASLVDACTDRTAEPGAPRDETTWEQRKRDHLSHLARLPADHLLVPAADKLSNARSMIDDHADVGATLWHRFNASPLRIAWYYTAMADVVRGALPGTPISRRLDRAAADLGRLAERDA